MLSFTSLDAAIPLVKALSIKKLGLQPLADTPLASLIEAGKTGVEYQPSQENNDPATADFQCIANAVQYAATSGDVGGVVPHSLIMDELVKFLSPHISNHIAFARNVVMPKIIEATDRLNRDIASMPSLISKFTTRTYVAPLPFTNRLVEGAIAEYADAGYDPTFNLGFFTNDLSFEEIVKLMMNGSASLDKDITNWANGLNKTFVEETFSHVFGTSNKDYKLVNNITGGDFVVGSGITNDLDAMLLIYFIAKKLLDTPPSDVNVGTGVYNDKMEDLIRYVGNRLYIAYINYYKAIEDNKVLVRGVVDDTVIVVYDGPFKHFISNGGSVEALLGLIFFTKDKSRASMPYYTNDILEKKTELEGLYNRNVALISISESNNKFTAAKRILKDTVQRMIKDEVVEDPSIPYQEYYDRLDDVIDSLKSSDLDNIPELAMKLICRTRYYRHAAEDILNSINRIAKENPTISIREVSAIAAIDYIVDYLFEQTKVV